MRWSELVRWSGSIGIFYILIPAYLVASDLALRWLIPTPAPDVSWPWLGLILAVGGVMGAYLVIASIGAQVVRGRGHPFDMTGAESFSRPTQVLLTRGVYALCRNPMGLGDVLLYACLTWWTGSFWSLLLQVPAYALVVAWNHRFNERPALAHRFGDDYTRYERVTPLLMPSPRSIARALRRGP